MKKEKSNKNLVKINDRIVFFATNNIHKFNEARLILSKYNIAMIMLRLKKNELQSESLKDIAYSIAIELFKKYNIPILVEDSGLFIDSLNGFPGPYTAYVYKTIGNYGIIKLMKNVKNRTAFFKSSVAFCYSDDNEPKLFDGTVKGKITYKKISDNSLYGFGFDPIFEPEGNSKLFSEMSIPEKNLVSHRALAFLKFIKWYLEKNINNKNL